MRAGIFGANSARYGHLRRGDRGPAADHGVPAGGERQGRGGAGGECGRDPRNVLLSRAGRDAAAADERRAVLHLRRRGLDDAGRRVAGQAERHLSHALARADLGERRCPVGSFARNDRHRPEPRLGAQRRRRQKSLRAQDSAGPLQLRGQLRADLDRRSECALGLATARRSPRSARERHRPLDRPLRRQVQPRPQLLPQRLATPSSGRFFLLDSSRALLAFLAFVRVVVVVAFWWCCPPRRELFAPEEGGEALLAVEGGEGPLVALGGVPDVDVAVEARGGEEQCRRPRMLGERSHGAGGAGVAGFDAQLSQVEGPHVAGDVAKERRRVV
mmetsp:Transcript_3069/g.9353  ORF Transcript_3069/g.9353 Transcript_3069/m.9353 type:complete len:330 (+) Transcript_3069:5-994(+)